MASTMYFGLDGTSGKAKSLARARKEHANVTVKMSDVDKLDIAAPPPSKEMSDSEVFTKVWKAWS